MPTLSLAFPILIYCALCSAMPQIHSGPPRFFPIVSASLPFVYLVCFVVRIPMPFFCGLLCSFAAIDSPVLFSRFSRFGCGSAAPHSRAAIPPDVSTQSTRRGTPPGSGNPARAGHPKLFRALIPSRRPGTAPAAVSRNLAVGREVVAKQIFAQGEECGARISFVDL